MNPDANKKRAEYLREMERAVRTIVALCQEFRAPATTAEVERFAKEMEAALAKHPWNEIVGRGKEEPDERRDG